MRDAYRERRDRAVEAAAAHGLDVFRTQGTFYMLVDIAPAGLSAREFTLRLLDELARRGRAGRGVRARAARASCASRSRVEADVLVEGMSRIARAIETFAA